MAASRARVLAGRRADPSDPPPPRLGTITGLICWSNWSSTKPSTGILLSQILSRRTPLWHSGELGRTIYVLCTDVCVRTMMPILTLIVALNHSLIFNPYIRVKRQRYQFKLKSENAHSTLSDEREQALREVGFVFDSHEAMWEERFNQLIRFRETQGHVRVPTKYPANPQLSIWVK